MLLDPETKQPIHKAMLILLTDRLLIESTFSLNNLAAVNVRDRESGTSAADQLLKLLVFPEQRIELVVGRYLQLRMKTFMRKRRRELPAELDDCIAHRDLDQAVELIHEWKQCSTKHPSIDAQLQLRESQTRCCSWWPKGYEESKNTINTTGKRNVCNGLIFTTSKCSATSCCKGYSSFGGTPFLCSTTLHIILSSSYGCCQRVPFTAAVLLSGIFEIIILINRNIWLVFYSYWNVSYYQVLPLCESTLFGEDDPSDLLSRLLLDHFPKLVLYAKDSEEEVLDEEEVAHI
uniref:Uncharacterized protein n=1 Tax=Heterorhabditis bacteriophora TaxID=37862 RepID=A0A1I7XNW2_HETBA